jgi:hypothetical protein
LFLKKYGNVLLVWFYVVNVTSMFFTCPMRARGARAVADAARLLMHKGVILYCFSSRDVAAHAVAYAPALG